MKRIPVAILAAALLATTVASTAVAETFRLSIGAGQSADAAVWLGSMRDWLAPEIAKRVQQRTSHKIEWINAFGGTICKMGECLEAVESGLIDVADLHANFEPTKMMAHNFGVFVPFGAADPILGAKAARMVYDKVPELSKVLETRYNQIFFAVGVVGNYNLITTFPWKTFDQLKNKKIAAAGPNASWLRAVGAVPVQSSLGEAYTSLQTGVYDGWIMLADGIVGFKLHEIAKNYTITDFGAMPNQVITINKNTWKKLPKSIQDIFMEVGREYTDVEAKRVAEKTTLGIDIMKASGVNVRQLSDADKTAWAMRLPDIPTERTAEIKAAGQASASVKAYITALKELGVKMPRDWKVQ